MLQPMKIKTFSSNFSCHVCISGRRLWQHVTESLLQKDMEKATEHKRFLEERQRKEERHRTETETQWRTKYFERKVINTVNTISFTISQFLKLEACHVLGVVCSVFNYMNHKDQMHFSIEDGSNLISVHFKNRFTLVVCFP